MKKKNSLRERLNPHSHHRRLSDLVYIHGNNQVIRPPVDSIIILFPVGRVGKFESADCINFLLLIFSVVIFGILHVIFFTEKNNNLKLKKDPAAQLVISVTTHWTRNNFFLGWP